MKLSIILNEVPKPIVNNIEKHYTIIKTMYSRGIFESSELNGAKFCESVYRLLEWKTKGNYTQFGRNIPQFAEKCREFIKCLGFDESIRFHIPNALIAIHDIRNKRGVGHAAGEVDANHMDAQFIISASDWILAELVRLFYKNNITTDEAQEIIETIITKKIPLVWCIFGVKRVLKKSLPAKQKTLVLLYSEAKGIAENTLFEWVEHSNAAVYRRDVLNQLHKEGLIEYNKKLKKIIISPTGNQFVEKNISLEL